MKLTKASIFYQDKLEVIIRNNNCLHKQLVENYFTSYSHLSAVAKVIVIDRSYVPLDEYIFKQRHPIADTRLITMICDSLPIAINVPIHSTDFPLFCVLSICTY